MDNPGKAKRALRLPGDKRGSCLEHGEKKKKETPTGFDVYQDSNLSFAPN